jgi:hypothetical protein
VGLEQMLRRRQINGRSRGRSLRFRFAMPAFPADLAEMLRWRLARIAELLRWPFERLAWAIERKLLWPLRERLAGSGPLGPKAGAAALATVAVAAVLAGALLLPQGNGDREEVASQAKVAVVTAQPTAPAPSGRPRGHVLKGVAPTFGVGKGVDVGGASDTEASEGGGAELNAGSPGAEAASASEEAAASDEAAATTSSAKSEPAGPAAMKIARRFSEAFVFYEIGQRPARWEAVFAETATPELASALEERPPRQPADAKVPKARVLNLVPGPRAGRAYTVSVSLLRVGVTSELRLSLQKEKDGGWHVVQVLG